MPPSINAPRFNPMKKAALVSVAAGALILLAGCASTTTPVASTDTPSLPAEVFNLADLDQPPQSAGIPARPNYPVALRQSNISGHAVLRFIVTADGRTAGIVVEKATHPGFGEAATEAVAKWRYRPALKDGRPVACSLIIPVFFNLNDFSR